ncbi:helix-turn-helix domain-containing protein [Donghicola tyrosinivorans]|uniref:Replication initiation protein RepC n=1 Tax=Donghicola tyrosinivorans TaxID=1652492 RepID=A0A2T0WEC4_9RHOB|nr:helix-turn-helix domain-containing protein [Donghicola tyrosinivorans]PRY85073.1 replication initiation protein RepC [Donghicola tyrosinivorans]
MNHTSTTVRVGAKQACALPFAGMGAIAAQPFFKPITRRALLAAVNTAAKDLGLRSSNLVVLDALFSFLACRDPQTQSERPITPLTLLTVYASNDRLCERSKGLTDRQLRRHFDKLESLGLITRRDSNNGKRFPIKEGGHVIGAYGIDLSPLLSRAEEIVELAEKREAEQQELRGLKARIGKLLGLCGDLSLPTHVTERLLGVRNILRRATTSVTEIRALLNWMQGLVAPDDQPAEQPTAVESTPKPTPCPRSNTNKTTATDGQNVRHIEPLKSDTQKKSRSEVKRWSDLKSVSAFFPEEPQTQDAAITIIRSLGHMLGVTKETLASGLQKAGILGMLVRLDTITEKCAEIANPDRYLRHTL